jgi:FlaA1/EpsC-like NDP-sugar epimerase
MRITDGNQTNSMETLFERYYYGISRRGKHWILRLIDIVAFTVAIYLAFSLRYDFFETWGQLRKYFELLIIIYPVKLICFWIAGVYRPVLRYAGLEFLRVVVIGVFGSTGVMAVLLWPKIPRSVLIMDAILTLVLVVGIRVLLRWLVYRALSQSKSDLPRENVLIYGAGQTGDQLANALAGDDHYRIVGFVDDDPQLKNQLVSGIRVYARASLGKTVKKLGVNSILLAIPSLGRQQRRELVEQLVYPGIQIKTVPSMQDIVSGRVSISDIQQVDITDLLGRDEVEPDWDLMKLNIQDAVVMVTGAGGSIGSELCRQIVDLQPHRLVLFELNEFALYSIESELQERLSDIDLVPCLGSVADQQRVEDVCRDNQVETVFHAAAYKHVPLLESNSAEAVLNNVGGTLSAAQAAINTGVKTFVLISTDKAVRPTNVMGTTKRIAELILQGMTQKYPSSTRFVIVRFGNVLDSTGSVVPRFRKQIADGRNITLTHPEITRFFMTIPEAARLVIQAGALGKGGDVFLLDMGDPVRIYHLAKEMIELSGLRLGEDIDITITGLRPGEKLYEELLIDTGKATQTRHPKIFAANEPFLNWDDLQPKLERLIVGARSADRGQMLSNLQLLVPECKLTG